MANARLLPDDPVPHARELIEQGSAAEAASFLQSLIDEGRGGLLARAMLVDALLAAGDIARGVDVARESASLYANVPVAILAFGRALLAAGALPPAIAEFQRALRLDPESGDARYQLGLAWLNAGEPEKALEQFAELLPDRAPANLQRSVDEAEAMRSAPRSNANYVQHLFDQFSSDYDLRMLGQLGYAAPQILRELARLVLPVAAERSLAILDLGCGTGLSGLAFADLAKQLDGIDLSPAMVAKASGRGVYRNLIAGDIETVAIDPGAYDLVVCADTLVYLGDLSVAFAQVCRALKPDGLFLFTAEKNAGDGFALGPKRRWRHAESYLRSEAERAGFDVAGLLDCVPRHEAGEPVAGYAVALRRKDMP
jgi:predicted TPR repeat methyltransferase